MENISRKNNYEEHLLLSKNTVINLEKRTRRRIQRKCQLAPLSDSLDDLGFLPKSQFPTAKKLKQNFLLQIARSIFFLHRSKYENVLLQISLTAYPLNPSASIVLKNSSLSSHFRARIFSTKDGITTKNQRQDILAPPPIRQF